MLQVYDLTLFFRPFPPLPFPCKLTGAQVSIAFPVESLGCKHNKYHGRIKSLDESNPRIHLIRHIPLLTAKYSIGSNKTIEPNQ